MQFSQDITDNGTSTPAAWYFTEHNPTGSRWTEYGSEALLEAYEIMTTEVNNFYSHKTY